MFGIRGLLLLLSALATACLNIDYTRDGAGGSAGGPSEALGGGGPAGGGPGGGGAPGGGAPGGGGPDGGGAPGGGAPGGGGSPP